MQPECPLHILDALIHLRQMEQSHVDAHVDESCQNVHEQIHKMTSPVGFL